MQQLIQVKLSTQSNKFSIVDYIQLDPFAPNTGRRFNFVCKGDALLSVDVDDIVRLEISLFNKDYGHDIYSSFDLLVIDYSSEISMSNIWWIYGHVNEIGDAEYKQGIIDIFNKWQKSEVVDWFNIPINSHIKSNYFSACRIFSGLSKAYINRPKYEFDISLIQEESDFFYMAALQFVGDKGYLGYDLFTFEDCLLELYHANGYFLGKRIIFVNEDQIYNVELKLFFEKVKSIFLRYKFTIDVNSN